MLHSALRMPELVVRDQEEMLALTIKLAGNTGLRFAVLLLGLLAFSFLTLFGGMMHTL